MRSKQPRGSNLSGLHVALAFILLALISLFAVSTVGFAKDELPKGVKKQKVTLTMLRQKDGSYIARSMYPIKIQLLPLKASTGAVRIQARCVAFNSVRDVGKSIMKGGGEKVVIVHEVKFICDGETFRWGGMIFEQER
jgi:hypothetical protein